MDFLTAVAALQTIPTPGELFPGLSAQGAWLETGRLIGLWLGITTGIALMICGVRGGLR